MRTTLSAPVQQQALQMKTMLSEPSTHYLHQTMARTMLRIRMIQGVSMSRKADRMLMAMLQVPRVAQAPVQRPLMHQTRTTEHC